MRCLALLPLAILLASCGSESKPPEAGAQKKAEIAKPTDESRRFPKANLIETHVVDKQLLGKAFMPGGTIAKYKKGKIEYEMFVAKLPSANDAALVLPDWRTALSGAKLIPSFGGYFGEDGGRPVFVFSKGAWIAGIVGLSEKQADAEARTLAGLLN